MNLQRLPLALFVATLPAVAGGCLIMSSNEKIVGVDDPRVPVDFESDDGFVTFHQAVRRHDTESARRLGESDIAIPFILASSTERQLSDNAYFNRQVKSADVNDDGVLSDLEVRAYAGRPLESAHGTVASDSGDDTSDSGDDAE